MYDLKSARELVSAGENNLCSGVYFENVHTEELQTDELPHRDGMMRLVDETVRAHKVKSQGGRTVKLCGADANAESTVCSTAAQCDPSQNDRSW